MTISYTLSGKRLINQDGDVTGVVAVVRAKDTAINSNIESFADRSKNITPVASMSTSLLQSECESVADSLDDGGKTVYNRAEILLNLLLASSSVGTEETF